MTPERWARVEELYHAARARPASGRRAFLDDACGNDFALRREVDTLLDEPVSGEGLLGEPACVAPAGVEGTVATAALAGRPLGGYRLQSLLGAGGMGEVFRALDTKLGREVAIKILPHAFTSDPDRLARFD